MHENGEQEQSPPSRQHGLCPGADSSRTCPPQNSSFSLLPPLASARTRHPLTVQGCLSHPRSYRSSCGGRNFPCRPPWVCLHKDIKGGLCGSCLGRSHLRGYPSAWGTQPHTCSRRETWLLSYKISAIKALSNTFLSVNRSAWWLLKPRRVKIHGMTMVGTSLSCLWRLFFCTVTPWINSRRSSPCASCHGRGHSSISPMGSLWLKPAVAVSGRDKGLKCQ